MTAEGSGSHKVHGVEKVLSAGGKGLVYGLIPGLVVGTLTSFRYGLGGQLLVKTMGKCLAGGSAFGGAFLFMHTLIRL